MYVFRGIILAALAVLAFATMPVIAATYAFSNEDNGRTVNVNQGDTFTVSLPENPSTGFRWILETSGGIHTIQDTYQRSTTGLIGAGGVRTWKFLVSERGTHTISAIYKQSWMPTTGDEQSYTLVLVSGQKTAAKPVSLNKFGTYFKPISSKTVYFKPV
ncbi:MAG: protease inhibitor I42 family protein [Methanolinea sp.]|nr:protease inhibitor I42 family protein [Methanolinea sp.]